MSKNIVILTKIKIVVYLKELIEILTFINDQYEGQDEGVHVLIRDECEMLKTTNGHVSKSGIHDISDVKFQTGIRTENNQQTKHWIVTLCFEDTGKIKNLTNAN